MPVGPGRTGLTRRSRTAGRKTGNRVPVDGFISSLKRFVHQFLRRRPAVLPSPAASCRNDRAAAATQPAIYQIIVKMACSQQEAYV